jgi:adenylate cyclase
MAVWGNAQTTGSRDDALNAVRAAVAMRDKLIELNESWRARGLGPLHIGIAVNHGDVVVGNIGSPKRMEFTVIGDAVNVTWKMQELTKELGHELVVGHGVRDFVSDHFDCRSVGLVTLRGVDHSTELFAVVGPVRPVATEISDTVLQPRLEIV